MTLIPAPETIARFREALSRILHRAGDRVDPTRAPRIRLNREATR